MLSFLITGACAFSLNSVSALSVVGNKESVNREADKKSARDLYQQNCARCHGADGKGGTELGDLFGVPDLTDKSVRRMSRKTVARIILKGKGGMPGFSKKLNAAQINLLSGYVRSLR